VHCYSRTVIITCDWGSQDEDRICGTSWLASKFGVRKPEVVEQNYQLLAAMLSEHRAHGPVVLSSTTGVLILASSMGPSAIYCLERGKARLLERIVAPIFPPTSDILQGFRLWSPSRSSRSHESIRCSLHLHIVHSNWGASRDVRVDPYYHS